MHIKKIAQAIVCLNFFWLSIQQESFQAIGLSSGSAKLQAREANNYKSGQVFFYEKAWCLSHLATSSINYSVEASSQYSQGMLAALKAALEKEPEQFIGKPKKLMATAWRDTLALPVEGEITGLIGTLSLMEDMILFNTALIGQNHFYCIIRQGRVIFMSELPDSFEHPNRVPNNQSGDSIDGLFISNQKSPQMAHTRFNLLEPGDVVIMGTENIRRNMQCDQMATIIGASSHLDTQLMAQTLLSKVIAIEDEAVLSVSQVVTKSSSESDL